MNSFPLDDIKVISLEQAVAAPFASRQLAELGARVIKVESQKLEILLEIMTILFRVYLQILFG